jgi:putative transcriptional regulator
MHEYLSASSTERGQSVTLNFRLLVSGSPRDVTSPLDIPRTFCKVNITTREARHGCSIRRLQTLQLPHRLLMENRLRALRATRSWSQQDLAERLEVSRQSVNAIETGKYDASLPLAFRIAELFELPIEEIFVSPSRRSSKAI